jgi:hypothetical protein
MYAIDEVVSADMWLGLNVKWSALWLTTVGWFWCIGDGNFVPTLLCPLEFTFAFCCWLRSLLLLELKLWDGIDKGDVNEWQRGGWWKCGFGRWDGDIAPLPHGEFWIPFEEHDVLLLDTLGFRCHSGLELGLSPSIFSRIDRGGGACAPNVVVLAVGKGEVTQLQLSLLLWSHDLHWWIQ